MKRPPSRRGNQLLQTADLGAFSARGRADHHPLNGRHLILNVRPLTQPAQPVVAAAAAAAEQRRRQPKVALELLRRLPAEPPRYRVASAADASHAAYAPVGRKPRFIAPRHAARVAGRRLDAAVADVCREHRPLRHRSHR